MSDSDKAGGWLDSITQYTSINFSHNTRYSIRARWRGNVSKRRDRYCFTASSECEESTSRSYAPSSSTINTCDQNNIDNIYIIDDIRFYDLFLILQQKGTKCTYRTRGSDQIDHSVSSQPPSTNSNFIRPDVAPKNKISISLQLPHLATPGIQHHPCLWRRSIVCSRSRVKTKRLRAVPLAPLFSASRTSPSGLGGDEVSPYPNVAEEFHTALEACVPRGSNGADALSALRLLDSLLQSGDLRRVRDMFEFEDGTWSDEHPETEEDGNDDHMGGCSARSRSPLVREKGRGEWSRSAGVRFGQQAIGNQVIAQLFLLWAAL